MGCSKCYPGKGRMADAEGRCQHRPLDQLSVLPRLLCYFHMERSWSSPCILAKQASPYFYLFLSIFTSSKKICRMKLLRKHSLTRPYNCHTPYHAIPQLNTWLHYLTRCEGVDGSNFDSFNESEHGGLVRSTKCPTVPVTRPVCCFFGALLWRHPAWKKRSAGAFAVESPHGRSFTAYVI